jgi:N,N'-diacetyllegionaminate synthase
MYFNSKINPVLFIAEVGSNHEGNFLEAKKLVLQACSSKADIIKLQIFTADNLVSRNYDKKRYDHFKKLELSISQNKKLCKLIKSKKKICSASVWDVNQIETFNDYIDVYKIGSGDIHNFEIIKKIILLDKPVILSTGLSNVDEIKKTLSFIKKINKRFIKSGKLAILHCNTAYPTPKEDSYLDTVNFFNKTFKVTVGFSDHSTGDEIITYAFLRGAKVIEKHFSNNIKKKTFRDHAISLNKEMVDNFLNKINTINKYLKVKNKLTDSEKKQKNLLSFRRSVYAKENIQKGEVFSTNNIICLRPFKKISSSNFFDLINKKSKIKYNKGDLIKL